MAYDAAILIGCITGSTLPSICLSVCTVTHLYVREKESNVHTASCVMCVWTNREQCSTQPHNTFGRNVFLLSVFSEWGPVSHCFFWLRN